MSDESNQTAALSLSRGMSFRGSPLRHVWLLLLVVFTCGADEAAIESGRDAKSRLSALQVYVGEWRGVGQPKRGSTNDNWIEKAAWRWDFSDEMSAIVFACTDARYYSTGRVEAGPDEGEFRFVGVIPGEEKPETFTGKLDDGRLVFERDDAPEGRPARVSIRTVADGDRLLVLLESRRGKSTYSRLAEVSYTRQGSDFGKGGSVPECVVTGGYGSMAVSFMGKTYYVCCSGCKDLFDEDPEKVIAEYKERKAKERESQGKK